MKIKYNSPVVLTYTLVCVIVLILSESLGPFFRDIFTVQGHFGSYSNPVNYFRLVSHIAGHGSWGHLLGNFTFILLLGPILEEKYGSRELAMMIIATGLITGVLNILFFSNGLLGASGIVFMFIILSSISNAKSGEIPLTFILVSALFIGEEIMHSLRPDQVSQFAHILGGACGGMFGFALNQNKSGASE